MHQNRSILYILTYTCASRHRGVQFFDVGTSKSVARPSVFLPFDLEMRFSPHRRATFPLQNFKECSCTFSIANVLRATAACNFSASELKKCSENEVFVHFHLQMCFAPQRCAIFRHQNFKKCSEAEVFLYIFNCKCASRHSSVQFFSFRT